MKCEVPKTGGRTLVMGIINATPDSFSDGGLLVDPEAAVARARQMLADGADLIDIGGESTRPGAEPVSAEVECARVLPVLEALCKLDACVSIDTYHAETARRALELGAAMVNDISAFSLDPALAEVVGAYSCHYVLMHMQGTPQTMQAAPRYGNVVDDICAFFDERLTVCAKAGVCEERVWLDPGFGFGKTVEHNLEILCRFHEFKKFGRPLLIGTSNKGTIGKVLGADVHDRLEGNAATVAIAIWNGAQIVRVHDVKSMARVARMTDAIRFSARESEAVAG